MGAASNFTFLQSEQPFLSVHAGGPEALFPDPKMLDGIFAQIKTLAGGLS